MTLATFAGGILLPVLALAVLLTLARFIRGRAMADRVVALDLLGTLGIGIIVTYAIAMEEPVYLDTTIILALISFLSTVAFAYYLRRRGP